MSCAAIFLQIQALRFMSAPSEHVRPLCPAHYSLMLVNPNVLDWSASPERWDMTDSHDCECPVNGCPQHYSPGLGYFTLKENFEHQSATGSATLRISRSATQVICAHHKYSMFLESFDSSTKLGNFRCPNANCQQVMAIMTDGPPAYWLSEGHFGSVRI